ncbi:MAG: LptA/OstA family protein [Cyanobacteria bacterium J06639_1]
MSCRRRAIAIGLAASGLMWSGGGWRASAQTEQRALTITSDVQSANSITGVIVAEGNVTLRYPVEQLEARSQRATYYTQEQRIVLEGDVDIMQAQNRLRAAAITYLLTEGTIEALPPQGGQVESVYVFPPE